MDKNKAEKLLKEIASDPKIISGIHNYCDRWCERCTHSAFCTVYLMEQEFENDRENSDDENKEFWNDIHVMFEVAASMLQEMMEEMGIDPNNLPNDEQTEEMPDPKEEEAVKISREYSLKAHEWMKHHYSIIEEKHVQLADINEEQANQLVDVVEVLQHYVLLASAKTYRCHIQLQFDDEDDEYELNDALGSAKIAVIVIERSIAAWMKLMEISPEFEDDILGYLKDLSKVKRLILNRFPKAMEFKRPGFDE
jgi:hypothetical protein